MKLSNDVEKYEIGVTKMGQNYSYFLTVLIFMSVKDSKSLVCGTLICYGGHSSYPISPHDHFESSIHNFEGVFSTKVIMH